MLWVDAIMSNIHPRRNARKGVLEALFAQQFSDENPKVTLSRIFKSNNDQEKNFEFITDLFHCVLDNIELADNLI